MMSDVIDLIEATVRIEQVRSDGQSTVGSGFIVTATAPDGTPRTILITANHVFAEMPHDKAKLGLREQKADGAWRYTPVSLRIRDAHGDPLWTRHPTQDVAAIELPPGVVDAAVPAAELPGERALEALNVRPGDEMMVLGFPHGFAANSAGFPILRAGKVASYPLSPADRYPTFMVDFNVFAGNSGGPVYTVVASSPSATSPMPAPHVVITGVLTQQIKLRGDRLAIGNVTQADFITETLSLMRGRTPAEIAPSAGAVPTQDQLPVSDTATSSAWDRLKEAWHDLTQDLRVLMTRAWIVVRDWVLQRITPDPRKA